MKIKNISPLGDLSVPVFRLEVKAGATVEVAPEVAEKLLAQPFHWAAADKAAAATTLSAVDSAEE